MAAGLAHELNNPIMYMLGFSEQMQHELKSSQDLNRETLLNYTNTLNEGGRKLSKIVSNFRDFSRKSGGQRKKTVVSKCLESAVLFMEGQLKLASISFSQEVTLQKECFLGDASRLEQVLVNLLINAKDALEESRDKKIAISSLVESNKIIVKISDNACGIDANNIKNIFDPFFTTKEVGKGTGLGLSVSHGIIKSFGGSLSVDSEIDKGTTFKIVLSLYQPSSKDIVVQWDAGKTVRDLDKSLDTAYGAVFKKLLEDYAQTICSEIGAHQSAVGYIPGGNFMLAVHAAALSDKYAKYREYDVMPNGKGIWGCAVNAGQIMRFSDKDLKAHPAWKIFSNLKTANGLEHPPMRGWLAVPVFRPNTQEVVGLLQLTDKFHGDFTEEDEKKLIKFAKEASYAFESYFEKTAYLREDS